MDTDNRALPLRIVASIWRGLDRLRRLLHLILLLGVLLLLLVSAIGERVLIPRTAALVIAPRGVLVDQLSGDALDRALARAQGAPLRETLVRDVIDALRSARDDGPKTGPRFRRRTGRATSDRKRRLSSSGRSSVRLPPRRRAGPGEHERHVASEHVGLDRAIASRGRNRRGAERR